MYSVVNHKAPPDGDEGALWLKILVPNKYLINMYSNETRKELIEKINSEKISS
ncbi:hypothetical protein CFOLD11_11380 [Clostridium folliculivorans]|uniref:Uncharacterized protein n=1 Tax=Clostridium folliculivorans TaxID=2886038 RepID=A0A9W5Y0L2_9CLOT|nr:hypothetical protein [Clostridium folliculivorans]GKU24312.1 hypothetical protein CFOLD11_11380 [Clostridium folliculivorans]